MTTNQLLDLLSLAIAWTIGAIFIYFRRNDVKKLPDTRALAIINSFIGFVMGSTLLNFSGFIGTVTGATAGAILGIVLSLLPEPKTKSKDNTDINKQK